MRSWIERRICRYRKGPFFAIVGNSQRIGFAINSDGSTNVVTRLTSCNGSLQSWPGIRCKVITFGVGIRSIRNTTGYDKFPLTNVDGITLRGARISCCICRNIFESDSMIISIIGHSPCWNRKLPVPMRINISNIICCTIYFNFES